MRKQKGFTLIELLIVVAIIGIVAAIAIPNVLMAIQRGKQKGSMGDMHSLCNACSAYVIDNSFAPAATDMATVLAIPNFNNFYAQGANRVDGWGNDYVYAQYDTGTNMMDGYRIGSGGKDGAGDLNQGTLLTPIYYRCRRIQDFIFDINFDIGTLVYGPDVKN